MEDTSDGDRNSRNDAELSPRTEAKLLTKPTETSESLVIVETKEAPVLRKIVTPNSIRFVEEKPSEKENRKTSKKIGVVFDECAKNGCECYWRSQKNNGTFHEDKGRCRSQKSEI